MNAKTITLVLVMAKLRQKVPVVPKIIKKKISFLVLASTPFQLLSFWNKNRISYIENTTASKIEQKSKIPIFSINGTNSSPVDQNNLDKME